MSQFILLLTESETIKKREQKPRRNKCLLCVSNFITKTRAQTTYKIAKRADFGIYHSFHPEPATILKSMKGSDRKMCTLIFNDLQH